MHTQAHYLIRNVMHMILLIWFIQTKITTGTRVCKPCLKLSRPADWISCFRKHRKTNFESIFKDFNDPIMMDCRLTCYVLQRDMLKVKMNLLLVSFQGSCAVIGFHFNGNVCLRFGLILLTTD